MKNDFIKDLISRQREKLEKKKSPLEELVYVETIKIAKAEGLLDDDANREDFLINMKSILQSLLEKGINTIDIAGGKVLIRNYDN